MEHKPPGWYVIDGQEFGPDSVFSYAIRLKGRPYARAKAYVIAETLRLKGELGCDLGEPHYVTEITAEIHHKVKKDCHVARTLGIACHSHNSKRGDPTISTARAPSPSETREREKTSATASPPTASSLETAKHDPERDAWDRLIEKNDPCDPWIEMQKRGCDMNHSLTGDYYIASDLTELAVILLKDANYGKYSSETFMRYCREDRFDTIEMIKDKGRWWVRPRYRARLPITNIEV